MTAHEELRRELLEALRLRGFRPSQELVDLVLAVLERRGDDDAARGLRARIEKLARQYERLSDELHLVPAANAFHDAALDLRRALDGDDTGSGQ